MQSGAHVVVPTYKPCVHQTLKLGALWCSFASAHCKEIASMFFMCVGHNQNRDTPLEFCLILKRTRAYVEMPLQVRALVDFDTNTAASRIRLGLGDDFC
jgi:hypothetical protein